MNTCESVNIDCKSLASGLTWDVHDEDSYFLDWSRYLLRVVLEEMIKNSVV